MPKLIGINGFKGSGKDTVYGFLAGAQQDKNVARVAFADRLKLMAVSALGVNLGDDEFQLTVADQLKADGVLDVSWGALEHHGTHITGRQYLQFFGAEARRLFGDTFWINQVLPEPGPGWQLSGPELLEIAYPDVDVLVVTDVRYENEARRVKALGGEVWEVVRSGLESDGHSSEVPLPRDVVDLTIHNNGSFDDLRERVIELV